MCYLRPSAAISGFMVFGVLAGGAWAQAYPAKAIRVVVPFAPGGIADFAARSVSQRLAESLGVPVVVENRAGAAGITGSDIVAKSAPDGYTVLVTSISHTINLSVNKNLPYDCFSMRGSASCAAWRLRVASASPQHPSSQRSPNRAYPATK